MKDDTAMAVVALLGFLVGVTVSLFWATPLAEKVILFFLFCLFLFFVVAWGRNTTVRIRKCGSQWWRSVGATFFEIWLAVLAVIAAVQEYLHSFCDTGLGALLGY